MTWLDLAPGEPFGIHNLPYCSFASRGMRAVGVRIGDQVLNLSGAEEATLIDAGGALAGSSTVDRFLVAGRPTWSRVREQIIALLTDEHRRPAAQRLLSPFADDETGLQMPFAVADYVDFYSSEHHASNVGQIFRPGQQPLTPNWKHLPIGYHGRAGTVVVSGTDVIRPAGQRMPADAPAPVFGPSTRLDIEAEVGFVIGTGSRPGTAVSTDDFRDHVFGVVLLNDWSARDIQAWEYQPLGPFLGKSFATSISPWVVPLDALEAARVPAPAQDPPVVGYLTETDRYSYDLTLEVRWNGTVVSRPPFRTLYWSPAQQLAHMTINGARLRPGDLFASGTVSGPIRSQTGSFLELTWGGTEPFTLEDGSSRTFLLDGDTVTITGTAPGPNGSVLGLGEVTGTVRAAP